MAPAPSVQRVSLLLALLGVMAMAGVLANAFNVLLRGPLPPPAMVTVLVMPVPPEPKRRPPPAPRARPAPAPTPAETPQATQPPRSTGSRTFSSPDAPAAVAATARALPDYDFAEALLRYVEAHRMIQPSLPAEGLVLVRIRIDRAGMLLDAQVERSSGIGHLDDAALTLIRSAAPFPTVPPELADPFEVIVPVSFPAPDPASLACLTVVSATVTFVPAAPMSPNGCAAGQPAPDRVLPGG